MSNCTDGVVGRFETKTACGAVVDTDQCRYGGMAHVLAIPASGEAANGSVYDTGVLLVATDGRILSVTHVGDGVLDRPRYLDPKAFKKPAKYRLSGNLEVTSGKTARSQKTELVELSDIKGDITKGRYPRVNEAISDVTKKHVRVSLDMGLLNKLHDAINDKDDVDRKGLTLFFELDMRKEQFEYKDEEGEVRLFEYEVPEDTVNSCVLVKGNNGIGAIMTLASDPTRGEHVNRDVSEYRDIRDKLNASFTYPELWAAKQEPSDSESAA